MSTTSAVSLQLYAPDGKPIPPTVSRERLVDLARAAYERGGEHLDRDVMDIHLAETADKAACSLLRDQWKPDFPIAAYTELLSTVAALRSVLGYSPSPTACDVSAWARSVSDASAAAAGDDKEFHEVRVCEGPHMGILLPLWGPKAPQDQGAAGPPLTLELATERGDSSHLEYDVARYKRLKEPSPYGRGWEYILDRDHPFPAEGSRPFMLADAEGAGRP